MELQANQPTNSNQFFQCKSFFVLIDRIYEKISYESENDVIAFKTVYDPSNGSLKVIGEVRISCSLCREYSQLLIDCPPLGGFTKRLYSQATILDILNRTLRPPPPPKQKTKQAWKNGAFSSSLILGGRGFSVPFYFVRDCSFHEASIKF